MRSSLERKTLSKIPPGGYSPAQFMELYRAKQSEAVKEYHVVVSVSLTSRELELVQRVMEQEGLDRSSAIRLLIKRGWAYTRLIEDEERLKNESSA